MRRAVDRARRAARALALALLVHGAWQATAVGAQDAPTPPPAGTKRAPTLPAPAPVRAPNADDDERQEDVDARAMQRLTAQALAGAGAVDGPGDASRVDPRRGATLRVFLLTFGQGDAVWERFGHNAIRILDTATGEDVAWNWGTFDFAQPNFVGRFLTGDTRYWLDGVDANLMARAYAEQLNRTVWQQELALTDAQKAALQEFVRWNAQEEHRYYRYDYYRDNCSTRVRDALDRVTGGALRRALTLRQTPETWRSHTRRLVAGDPFTYTGIQLALGRDADRALTAWEAGFLPVQLMEAVRTVRIARPSGGVAPLVLSERTLFTANRPAERAVPPTTWPWFLAAGLVLGGAVAALGRAAGPRVDAEGETREGSRGARVGFGVLAGVWTLLTGLLGTALLLAGTVTKHAPYMGKNLNLLAASPLALLLFVLILVAVCAPAGVRRERRAWRAAKLAGLVAALTLVGAVWTALPRVGQESFELFLAALPVHAAIAWGLGRIAGTARPAALTGIPVPAVPATGAAVAAAP